MWDAYVTPQGAALRQLNTSPLGFKDNVTRLNGFRNLSQSDTFFDGFRVVLPTIGDANGDGLVDYADAVAVVDFVATGSTDPIMAANADASGDGLFTAADAMQILNIILDK